MTEVKTTVDTGAKPDPHRWQKVYPWLGTGPIDAKTCTSPEYFQKEKEKIFDHVWWKVGRDEEIPNPGDLKVRKMHFADTSVVIVRGKDGKVRAFYNVCAHRGNTVVSEIPGQYEFYGKARGHALTCRFHGWVYSSKGDLLYVPQEEKFFDSMRQDDEAHGLVPIACDVWNGFIFINMDKTPRWSLKDFLGGYGEHLSGYDYGAAKQVFRYYTFLNANYKVCLDAFSEGYHVDTIHAGSFPCDWCGIENIQFWGPHRTSAITFSMASIGLGKVQSLAYSKSQSSIVDASRGRADLPPQMNPNNDPAWAFELGVIFPAFMPHPAQGFYFTHQFWPVAHNVTLWEGTNYMVSPTTNSARWSMEYSQVLQRNAWLEDTQTMENTHRALESGARKVMHLNDDEILIRHGYKVVDDWVNDRASMKW